MLCVVILILPPRVGGASPTGELNFHHCTACPSTCRRRAGPPHARVSASRAAPCRFPFALSKAVDTVALRLAVATGWRARPNRGAPIQPGFSVAGEDDVRFVWQCGCGQPHSAANKQIVICLLLFLISPRPRPSHASSAQY